MRRSTSRSAILKGGDWIFGFGSRPWCFTDTNKVVQCLVQWK
ncbi:hypothetical protein SEA_GENEVAB15_81 [Mycobacterium phage GenevaB15]|nr:hypothetical protein SEA_GENEVAB15_81 [Mycobacterium phage GenevaB15]